MRSFLRTSPPRLAWTPRVALLALLLPLTSCSVLEDEQVQAAKRFATITASYENLPGTVVAEYASLRERRVMLDQNSRASINVDRAVSALDTTKALQDTADEIDTLLDVLDTYAELLVRLTSDEFSTQLEASAKNLASEVDRAAGSLGPLGVANPDSAGALVAAAVRGIGGWFLKHRQQEMLREAVTAADPVIEAVTKRIEDILQTFVSTGGLIPNEIEDLKQLIGTIEARTALPQERNARAAVLELIRDAHALRLLAQRSLDSAKQYREAHSALAAATCESGDETSLRDRLDRAAGKLRVIARELKGAQRLQKSLRTD